MIPTYGDKPFESQRNPCTLCRFAFHPRLQILKELIRANADIRDLDRFHPNLHASASLGLLGVMGGNLIQAASLRVASSQRIPSGSRS